MAMHFVVDRLNRRNYLGCPDCQELIPAKITPKLSDTRSISQGGRVAGGGCPLGCPVEVVLSSLLWAPTADSLQNKGAWPASELGPWKQASPHLPHCTLCSTSVSMKSDLHFETSQLWPPLSSCWWGNCAVTSFCAISLQPPKKTCLMI